MNRKGAVTLLILALVVGVAAWSKLRFVGRDGCRDPQRWRVEEYPDPKGRQGADKADSGRPALGGRGV